MNRLRRIGVWVAIGVVGILAQAGPVFAGTATTAAEAETAHDGQHDFDFELGSWKIHLKKLVHPLTGSHEWVEFDGTSVTEKVWDGKAEIEQFETDNAVSGHIEEPDAAFVQSCVAPVEFVLGQQQDRHAWHSHGWRIQGWARGVLRPGRDRRAGDPVVRFVCGRGPTRIRHTSSSRFQTMAARRGR